MSPTPPLNVFCVFILLLLTLWNNVSIELFSGIMLLFSFVLLQSERDYLERVMLSSLTDEEGVEDELLTRARLESLLEVEAAEAAEALALYGDIADPLHSSSTAMRLVSDSAHSGERGEGGERGGASENSTRQDGKGVGMETGPSESLLAPYTAAYLPPDVDLILKLSELSEEEALQLALRESASSSFLPSSSSSAISSSFPSSYDSSLSSSFPSFLPSSSSSSSSYSSSSSSAATVYPPASRFAPSGSSSRRRLGPVILGPEVTPGVAGGAGGGVGGVDVGGVGGVGGGVLGGSESELLQQAMRLYSQNFASIGSNIGNNNKSNSSGHIGNSTSNVAMGTAEDEEEEELQRAIAESLR